MHVMHVSVIRTSVRGLWVGCIVGVWEDLDSRRVGGNTRLDRTIYLQYVKSKSNIMLYYAAL
jgi:hypothetical protein